MPTVFTHTAVPLALGLGAGRKQVPASLLLLGIAVSILPDGDVLGLHLGCPYESIFGHRGFTHSLGFSAAVALVGAIMLHRKCFLKALGFLFVAAASHPILDAFTTGGLGVALFWPFSEARYFAPWRVIRVSPLSVSRLFSARGFFVAGSELLWVWLPCLLFVTGAWIIRRRPAPGDNGIPGNEIAIP